jgi:SAM-dependent methyltransferase
VKTSLERDADPMPPATATTKNGELSCPIRNDRTGRLDKATPRRGLQALMALPIVGASGFVIGADISPAMLEGARARLNDPLFWPIAADGQALPFRDASFDRVICQLGLQFFPNPALGLAGFRRVLRSGGSAAVCVISTPDRAPMWGILADGLSRYLSVSFGDTTRLEGLLTGAGFRDIRVVREKREDIEF